MGGAGVSGSAGSTTGLAGTSGGGGTGGTPSISFKVQYRPAEANATNQTVNPQFKVFNNGSNSVALSTLTIRYWYTIDTQVAETAFVDFASLGPGNISLSNARLSPARTNADHYLQVGFAAAAGSLAAGANTGDIQVRFNKNDFSNYNETNDYSFDASKTDYADWDRATLYQNGTLVWGVEP